MKFFLFTLLLFSSLAQASDLIPEASGVSSMSAYANTCLGSSDCKTNINSMIKSLESKGFIILKTNNCSSKFTSYMPCPNGDKPTEQGSINFTK